MCILSSRDTSACASTYVFLVRREMTLVLGPKAIVGGDTILYAFGVCADKSELCREMLELELMCFRGYTYKQASRREDDAMITTIFPSQSAVQHMQKYRMGA